MRYMVYFVVPDHDCDGSSRNEPVEQTIVEAADVNEAGRLFFRDCESSGAYIQSIFPLPY